VAVKHPEECIQCGTCVSVCPVEMVGGHAIVTWLADPQAADYSVWLCTSCWRCHEACPAGVDIYGLMMERRRSGRAPAGYQDAFERVMASGLALEISQEDLDQARAVWNLESVSLPPSTVAQRLLDGDE
jgi:heterodisulfide reductase subunit C